MADSISISYPTANANVPGQGGFFSWGWATSGVTVNGALATWNGGAKPGVADTGPVVSGVATWAFRFGGLPTGTLITLVVTGTANGNPIASPPAQFTCGGLGLHPI
jgi:hypothetical protein